MKSVSVILITFLSAAITVTAYRGYSSGNAIYRRTEHIPHLSYRDLVDLYDREAELDELLDNDVYARYPEPWVSKGRIAKEASKPAKTTNTIMGQSATHIVECPSGVSSKCGDLQFDTQAKGYCKNGSNDYDLNGIGGVTRRDCSGCKCVEKPAES
jgi:hypothetical protein